MSINLSEPKEMYEELRLHVGHNIECVTYGQIGGNVTIECIDCGMVLVDVEVDVDEVLD